MHGPSSSHTAASQRISLLLRRLLGAEPRAATLTFDRSGSFAQVYDRQGADLAFAAGLMGWDLTDERFADALNAAARSDLSLRFQVADIPEADHPNAVRVELESLSGATLLASAKSTGGGMLEIASLDGWPLRITGERHELIVVFRREAEEAVREMLSRGISSSEVPKFISRADRSMLHLGRNRPFPDDIVVALGAIPGVTRVMRAEPVFFVRGGRALFSRAGEMVALAETRGETLGRLALAYESALLELPEDETAAEMIRRYEIMRAAVESGLAGEGAARSMLLLSPCAGSFLEAERAGRLAGGGVHARAAARAMAAMHVSSGGGLVCAAPTGGSAGVLPGVLTTLEDDLGFPREAVIRGLFAAAAVGLAILCKGTFAAEEAGCQVEIGAAGAMAAAAVVEAAGGSAGQAADAAAIALQNTMGSVCDLVRGVVEIPCHTRNAAAAASAFVCADLILGGYRNPIPLDETIEASIRVGRSLSPDLRCTARGGLAATPSARAMKLRRGQDKGE